MTETEKMQQLHSRQTSGEKLTPDESAALQNWYDELDREEDLRLNRNRLPIDSEAMRAELDEEIHELTGATQAVERTARENEGIRRENERLRRMLAQHFADKVTSTMDEIHAERNLSDTDFIEWANDYSRASDDSR